MNGVAPRGSSYLGADLSSTLRDHLDARAKIEVVWQCFGCSITPGSLGSSRVQEIPPGLHLTLIPPSVNECWARLSLWVSSERLIRIDDSSHGWELRSLRPRTAYEGCCDCPPAPLRAQLPLSRSREDEFGAALLQRARERIAGGWAEVETLFTAHV